MAGATHDVVLNDRINTVFGSAVDQILSGKGVSTVLSEAALEVETILQSF